MAQFSYEMFGNMVYDEALTYEELIEREPMLMAELTDSLRDFGASHIDFRQLGDALYMQCAFTEQEESNFQHIADTVAKLAGQHMEGRLLFLCRDLDSMDCFFFVNEVCQGGRLTLPSPHQGLAQTQPDMQYASAKDHKPSA
jgi:hypothetical protein